MKREGVLSLLCLCTLAVLVGLLSRRLVEPARTVPDDLPEGYKIRVAEDGVPLSDEERAYERVHEIASPGVVQITTRRYRRNFFGVAPEDGMGSGFVINEAGFILTNYHVIRGASEVEVGFTDGRRVAAEWVRVDPSLDLALVKIDPGGRPLHPLVLGNSSLLRIGQRVAAIGNPFGLSGTLTVGVVSALGRDIQTEDGKVIEDVIQTDASINPGNSGGPLLNLAGQVIGVNTAIFSPSGGSVGVGFAIAIDKIKAILPALIEGDVTPARGWLGIWTEELRGPLADGRTGAFVRHVVPGSPAERSGFEAGMIIEQLDGSPIATSEDLVARIGNLPPGRRIEIEIRVPAGDPADDVHRTIEVELGRRLE